MHSPLVIASSEHLGDVEALVGVADVLEIRLDLGAITPSAIHAYDGPIPLIVTNRPVGHGGSADPGADRIELLYEAIDAEQVWGVDIECDALSGDLGVTVASASTNLFERANDLGVTTICSTHLPRTPEASVMVDQLNTAHEYGDIAKLAVPVETPTELGELVRATAKAAQQELSFTTMATGSYGLISRVLSLGLGSRLVYGARTENRPMVEGQPSVETLGPIVDALR